MKNPRSSLGRIKVPYDAKILTSQFPWKNRKKHTFIIIDIKYKNPNLKSTYIGPG